MRLRTVYGPLSTNFCANFSGNFPVVADCVGDWNDDVHVGNVWLHGDEGNVWLHGDEGNVWLQGDEDVW